MSSVNSGQTIKNEIIKGFLILLLLAQKTLWRSKKGCKVYYLTTLRTFFLSLDSFSLNHFYTTHIGLLSAVYTSHNLSELWWSVLQFNSVLVKLISFLGTESEQFFCIRIPQPLIILGISVSILQHDFTETGFYMKLNYLFSARSLSFNLSGMLYPSTSSAVYFHFYWYSQ